MCRGPVPWRESGGPSHRGSRRGRACRPRGRKPRDGLRNAALRNRRRGLRTPGLLAIPRGRLAAPARPNESAADDTGDSTKAGHRPPLNRSAATLALQQGAARDAPEGLAVEGESKGRSRYPIVDVDGLHRTQGGVVAQPRRLTSHRYQEASVHSSETSSYDDRWRSFG